ncbi:peptidase S24/S26A/S26B/S26C [Boletus coccyginus]|nr:peptidase S24/S26A/S26B/S26C [Boletus coccyginus]
MNTLARTRRVLYWLPLGMAFTHYCYTIKTVRGRSMQPTLNPDIVLFDRLSVHSGRPIAKGDVVSLRDPVDSRKMIVKRVVAVADDVVQTLPPHPDPEVLVPEGHIWVEGDEPFRTLDSNSFGPVPLGLVDAKLTYIIWPLHRGGPLKPPERPVSEMGVPRDYRWRDAMAAFERERKRQARVTAASPKRDEAAVH